MKLNILLAKTDQAGKYFKTMLIAYSKFFNGNQGAFKGEKRTYIPKDEMMDEPGERKNHLIQTTVDEKFYYFIENSKEYINALFSQEKTNALGSATAELKVEETSWGTFTSLELLRLKSLIESGDFYKMLENIPTRSDAEIWETCTEESYQDRTVILQSPMQEGTKKTTERTAVILEDPNLKNMKNTDSYRPVTETVNTVMELGDYTYQKYSGEYSQRQRAGILSRRNNLLIAVIEALKEANGAEAVESELTAQKIFGYILDKS